MYHKTMLLGRVAVVLLVFGAAVAAAELAPPERSYNFLMLLPVSSKSHRNVFMPLATALAERGHKVTMLNNHDAPKAHPNIKFINHGLPHFREDEMEMFKTREDPSQMSKLFTTALPLIARDLYQLPAVKDIYRRRKEFDLIIIDHMFNEVTYPFVHERTFITVSTSGLDLMQSAVLGNVLNPSCATDLRGANMFTSFVQRAKNMAKTIFLPIMWRHSMVVPKVQEEISKQFPDLPPLLEIERNQSLVLMNSHFSMGLPTPLLPAQVEVGAMHCGPAKPLPKDLLDFVSGKEDVVYFSLGSVVKSSSMPEKYKKLFVSAFAKLPYKVMWKFEEELPGLSKNVLIKSWMPQQDFIAHPNVKLFISHGGMLGTQEAMYHGKPILTLPVFGDQEKNALTLEELGVSKMLVWEQLTEQIIVDTITELITNPKYIEKTQAISKAFKDQPERPVDRAVFWTEYVVRHQGAVHLRSPQRDLSWVQFLNLDVIAAVLVVLFMLYSLVKKLCCVCAGLCRGKKDGNKKQQKKKKE